MNCSSEARSFEVSMDLPREVVDPSEHLQEQADIFYGHIEEAEVEEDSMVRSLRE